MNKKTRFTHRASGGIEYHGFESGAGHSLLFLHGFTGHSAAYPDFLRQMEGYFRIISLDLPGHGNTTLPTALNASFLQIADDIAEIVRTRMQSSAHCVGYSMGGRLVLAMACRHSELVKTSCLISASPGIANSDSRRLRLAYDSDLASYMVGVPMAAFLDYWRRLPLFANGQSATSRNGLDQIDLRSRPLNVARSLSILGTGAQPSFWECLPVLNLPVQLICGSKDTRYVQLALEMQCRLPICRVELIPGAGHRAQVDRPREVSRKIIEFITQHRSERIQE